MSEFVIHSIPGSPFGRAVLVALEEKNARYRLAPVVPGTHRAPLHLARHPFGRVPVLEHDDFTLYETQAILRYIDRVHPAPALTPDEAAIAAAMPKARVVTCSSKSQFTERSFEVRRPLIDSKCARSIQLLLARTAA